jgi:hypothetical protein
MNMESKLWKLVQYGAQVAIIQKASGAMRMVSRSTLPDNVALAMASERWFDTIAREAFHRG